MLRFIFLLMLGLLGLQPAAYTYDAVGFVSLAEQCTYVPTAHYQAASTESAAPVPLCPNRDRAASASQANLCPTATSLAAESEIAGSARAVNPLGGTTNCVNCATAMDATLAGNPASALLGSPQPISVLGSDWVSVTGQAHVESLLQEAGPGARGIVFGADPAGDVGHVWNAVNQRGAVNFIDAQAGGGGAQNFQSFTNFHFLRTN
jgi:hypothetical protein